MRTPELTRLNAEILDVEIQLRKTDAPRLKRQLDHLVKARSALVDNLDKTDPEQPKSRRLQYGDNIEIKAQDGKETHIEHLFECITTSGNSFKGSQLLFVSNAPYREREIYILKFPNGDLACALVESITNVAAIDSNRVVFQVL